MNGGEDRQESFGDTRKLHVDYNLCTTRRMLSCVSTAVAVTTAGRSTDKIALKRKPPLETSFLALFTTTDPKVE